MSPSYFFVSFALFVVDQRKHREVNSKLNLVRNNGGDTKRTKNDGKFTKNERWVGNTTSPSSFFVSFALSVVHQGKHREVNSKLNLVRNNGGDTKRTKNDGKFTKNDGKFTKNERWVGNTTSPSSLFVSFVPFAVNQKKNQPAPHHNSP